MATVGSLPYGMTDLVIEELDSDFAVVDGNGVTLLYGQTFEITPTEDQTDVEGYGVVVGTVYSATKGDVTLTAAGTDLDALALITGGTVVETGTTPAVVQTLDIGVEDQARPYCQVTGRALGNSGGDAWLRANAVRFSIPGGNMDHKAFGTTSITGTAIVPPGGALLTRIHHETATALAPAA